MRNKRRLHRILSLFSLILWSVFWGLFSLLQLSWRISNAKFRITFRYLNMYVSTKKFPQIFLYMSTTCCESFKSFEEAGKKFFISNFYYPEISAPAKNSMNLPVFYAVLVSSAQTKHWRRSSQVYGEHVQKKFECKWYLVWIL